MDTISMLLTGWVIFIFCSIAVVKYLYMRFVRKTTFSELEVGNESETQPILSIAAGSTFSPPLVTDDTANESSQSNGTLSATRVVETISGPKSITNKDNKPQAPVRRRRVDKVSSSNVDESFDEFSAGNESGPCSGSDPLVTDFINACHEWAFTYKGTQKRSWEDIRETFINAVNKTLRDEDLKNDLVISVVDFHIKDEMKLKNIFAECIHPNNVKVTSDCELQLKGEVTVSSKESGLRRCQFFVDRLCGRISTLLDCGEKSAIVKLDGWPEICVGVSNSSPSKGQLDPKLSEAVGDRMTSAIRNSVVEIDYSHFQEFPVPPKLQPKKSDGGLDDKTKKYLWVKVIRGGELGLQKGCQEPYCAIELDEPPQKFQTDAVRSQDPVWNENFVFNFLPGVGEILFEVFDKAGTRFLGCNIMSVEEIGSDTNNRTLPLKSRRMEISDQFTGNLEVQFAFLNEKEYRQKAQEMSEKLSANGHLVKTTRAVFTRSPEAHSSQFAENVIKEFERKALPNPIKSTLIIHAVQREDLCPNSPSRSPTPVVKITKLSDGTYMEVRDDSSLQRKERLKNDEVSTGIEGQYGEERGRRKTRKGDIFTSIRRRFSKGRSQSAMSGGGGDTELIGEDKDDMFKRSVSAHSADRHSMASGRLGLGSARSSTSELSGISGYSTSTYVHESSRLVIESVENRIKKYYLVPPTLAETGKWKKRGKKLHIYNDHTFVAKHMSSGTVCEFCAGRITFSFGKQAYQCRDCKVNCHKECHIRAPSYCSKTSVFDIELCSVKPEEDKPSAFSTFINGLKNGNSVNVTNKDCLDGNGTNDDSDKNNGKGKKKKKSIFRKVTKLRKISEENLLMSKEKLNGDGIHYHHQTPKAIKLTSKNLPVLELNGNACIGSPSSNLSSPLSGIEELPISSVSSAEQIVEAETHNLPQDPPSITTCTTTLSAHGLLS